jgi:hypothetical protein
MLCFHTPEVRLQRQASLPGTVPGGDYPPKILLLSNHCVGHSHWLCPWQTVRVPLLLTQHGPLVRYPDLAQQGLRL